jgi:hypothetical protein
MAGEMKYRSNGENKANGETWRKWRRKHGSGSGNGKSIMRLAAMAKRRLAAKAIWLAK